jgi:cytochrome c556
MFRVVLAAAAAAVGASSVFAQSDLLPSTALMREQAQLLYRDLNGMVKGEAPYNQAKADEALTKLAATVAKIPAAFPESSKDKVSPNTRYSSSPKVWQNKVEFDVHVAKLSKALEESRSKVKNLDALKAAYPAINDACNACHQDFRLRRS